MSGTFRWEGDLVTNIDNMPDQHRKAIVAAANYVAPQIESFMKETAPWTDRTGNARSGLRTKVQVSGDKVAIICYHSVPYGPYLELRWGGKYGVILHALAAGGPLFAQTVAKLMFRRS